MLIAIQRPLPLPFGFSELVIGPEVSRDPAHRVILAGDPDEREERITPSISQRAPIRCGVAVSLMGQTGQSEAIHSPDACASTWSN